MRGRIDQHARYRELIAARLDKPLTRVELRSLNAHLKKCDACVNVDAEYRSQRNLVRGLAMNTPIPPRDLWARTSASLDREVARAYRAEKLRRRMARGRKSAQPSTGLMATVAAIGVTAAIAVLQLAPAIGPAASLAGRPTPLTVPAQRFSFLTIGNDVAVYRTDVSQVCPASGPLDCVEAENYTRTPIQLPPDMRAGNVTMSPTGDQLALVGHYVGEDVIAVVTMPAESGGSGGGKSGDLDHPRSTDAGGGVDPGATANPARTHNPNATSADNGNNLGTAQPASNPSLNPGAPESPPSSAVPGLAVLAILENVQSAGSPPDWSANGSILAFSAMPDDDSHGPDVYIWSPGDAKARAITSDHASFFASWSGNRIVLSRLVGNSQRVRNFVIDPRTGEERVVNGPQMWLPNVNVQKTQAVGWYGQLDTTGLLPQPRSGALYLMDWESIDPFGAAAPTPPPPPTATPTPSPTTEPTDPPTPTPTETPPPTKEPTPKPTDSPVVSEPTPSERPTLDPATPDAGERAINTSHGPEASAPARTGAPDPTQAPDPTAVPDATVEPDATTPPETAPAATQSPEDGTTQPAPATAAPAAPGTPEPPVATSNPDAGAPPTPEPPEPDANPASAPGALTPLEPDRDPRSAPVVDWQAHWSADGMVLGVWIADSVGSSWGRLAVLAVDPDTQRVSTGDALLPMTLARRGFSLGVNRVAWVGPSNDNVDGELRIKTWGSDGVGGLRLKSPEQEEVVPAS